MFDGDGDGHKAAGAAELLGNAIGGDAGYGIVAAPEDVAIVDQEDVGDAVEAPDSFLIVNDDRLFAEIGAGHDESFESTTSEKEMVERSVREEDTEETISGGDAGRKDGIWTGGKKDNRAFWREQLFTGEITHDAKAFGDFYALDHHGEGLFDAVLTLAELVDGGRVFCVAGQVKPSQALDGCDGALL